MQRIVWARFLSLIFVLAVLGLLFTASSGGVQAQAIPSQVISSQTHSSASELAKKPTKTPTATKTRKPKKTKTPTSTAAVTAAVTPSDTTTSTATFTATFTPTPEADVQASTLPAGVYHLSGTLTRVTQNVLTWWTPRGTFDVSLTAQSTINLGGERITVRKLQQGQWLDGLVRVN